MFKRQRPVGVVLAGGLGRRIGGSKATVELRGAPLISYPLAAMTSVLDDVAIIAKPDTKLPSLPGVAVWIEPPGRRHPLIGIIHALGLAGGRPVLVCASDLPFVTPRLIERLARADPKGGPAVVAASGEEIQPLLGCYQPRAAELLRKAIARENIPVRDAVSALGPRLLQVEDPEALFNVNGPDDLLLAAAILDRGRFGDPKKQV
jgi:molybdenum cofactor guanylyltransferase